MGNMGNETVPLVSVSVITYNHEKYIRQCLDGILMQNVNFPYEILVHDDASPDGTADIIREYEAKYPDIIKPIYQTENQYSQGKDASKFNFDRARGKYLAFCEGDDYWTDPGKLQKQVDFLERHPEYIATVHRVKAINEHGEELEIPGFTDVVEHVFTIDEYVRHPLPSQLASLVMRNVFLTLNFRILELYYSCKANGDVKLFLLLVVKGDIYCSSEEMATYRRIVSEGTSWNARMRGKNRAHIAYRNKLALQQFADEAFGIKLPASMLHDALPNALVEMTRNPTIPNAKILFNMFLSMPNKHSMVVYYLTRLPYYVKWALLKPSSRGSAPSEGKDL
jgi:glycosyltransferase involved in cell wall biosynthesis